LLDLQRRKHELVVKTADDGPGLECPVGVAWAGDVLCVADATLGKLALIGPDDRGRCVDGEWLERPSGVAFNKGTGQVLVSDSARHGIAIFDLNGNLVRSIGSRGSAPGLFNHPCQIACAVDGSIVVADSLNFRVQRISVDGQSLGAFGRKGDASGDFALPKGVAVDKSGNIWVVDAQFENIQAFDPTGQLLMVFGGEGRGPGEFWLPAGIAIDARNRMWIADSYNRRVQVFELLQ
jgi:DNA-binding beta-propeller fold protein YncE